MRFADSQCTYTENFVNGVHTYTYKGNCIYSGKEVKVTVKGSELFAYRQGKHIQDAFPDLTAGEREFLMSGICDEEFQRRFSDD